MKSKGLLIILLGMFTISGCNAAPTNTDNTNKNGDNNASISDGDNNNDNSNDDGKNDSDDNNRNQGPSVLDFGKDAVQLSFKSASSFEYLNTIKDQQVAINGYMATTSPVDGSFIFLMNMPYQNCPFCKPNTSQLSNTIEVYPKNKEKFNYTTSAVRIVGTLKVVDDINKPFTDPFKYEFVFKIVDADYKILKDSDLSGELALWQKFANTTLITDIYSMFDYIDFVCKWPSYYVNTFEGADGTIHPGYYLYPGDAKNFLEDEGAQYNYGYKDGYFDKIIKRINKISTTGFESLIKIINDAKTLSEYALNELYTGQYTYEEMYVERFDNTDYVYTLIDTTLAKQADDLYYAFADWLSSFEM